MNKRILSLLLVMVMTISFTPIISHAETSGTCGENLIWTLDDKGTLTISGTGDMKDYHYTENAPWYAERNNIKTINIQNGVTSIGNIAFYYCNVTSVTIPDGVTSIGEGAFRNCYDLANITIPNNVTSIGDFVFSDCRSLTSINIPNSVKTIGDYVFDNCSSLTSITVAEDNNVYMSIDGILFNKSATELIQFPPGRESIDYIIPDTVTTIGERAFYGCNSLTSVTIPNSVTSIGDFMFYYCRNLTAINVAEDNEVYSSINGVLFDKSVTTLIKYPGGKSGKYIIPSSVKTIGNHAFAWCTNLQSAEIPLSVTSIGKAAFYYCRPLTVYYEGSEEQWHSIGIATDNSDLNNATMYYNYNGLNFGDISMSYNNGTATINSPKAISVDFIIACYDINGVLIDFQKEDIELNVGDNFLPVEFLEAGNSTKLMIWDEKMCPLCDYKVIGL